MNSILRVDNFHQILESNLFSIPEEAKSRNLQTELPKLRYSRGIPLLHQRCLPNLLTRIPKHPGDASLSNLIQLWQCFPKKQCMQWQLCERSSGRHQAAKFKIVSNTGSQVTTFPWIHAFLLVVIQFQQLL